MDQKRSLLSPTSISFRTKRWFSSSLVFIISLTCIMIFSFGNFRIQKSSDWLKALHLPRHLFQDHNHHHHLSSPPNMDPQGHTLLASSYVDFNKSSENQTETPKKAEKKSWLEEMRDCDIYDGRWVKDDAASPLYEPGSCPLIDESFDCYRNGRPEHQYLKLRWQPNHCNIPRLDGGKMLRFFKGKRIVYVGDSLNRNMFESLVCLLRSSVKDKSRVYEASGRIELKKEGTYSFLFPDYNVTVEYIRSAFLVQEWETAVNGNDSKKETLRLDIIDRSYDEYKDADVLVFNTGNWWTHETRTQGKGYYQEGNHVHEKLDVIEAFDKAMATWARWVEAHVDPTKTRVFFRAYSFSHFSKGEWNTGGRCDEKEAISNVEHLLSIDELDPPIPRMLEKSVESVKVPLHYLNVTRMSNYRRDAHPSLYRKPNMTEEEKLDFESHQDCSHWCLPGVPDTWNQLMFAQLLLAHKQQLLKQHLLEHQPPASLN
ncbi:hypothetical protein ACS0TY_025631 [Phlomoides rotata]